MPLFFDCCMLVGMGISLQGLAGTVAAEFGDKGAIVISYSEDGVVRVGIANLSPQELLVALCTAIHHSFVLKEEGP